MWLLVLPANTARSPRAQRTLALWARRCVLERCGERHSCITLDSCGKADDPHNLEGGALAARAGHISKKRRRTLDAGWDVAAQEAGNSQAHPVNLG